MGAGSAFCNARPLRRRLGAAACGMSTELHRGGVAPLRRVVLLPGIWMPAVSMHWLGRRLSMQGFQVRLQAYPGVSGGPERAVSRLLPSLREADAVVCHSLGGLMTLEALRQQPDLPVQRVVCLGSPLRGSGVAARLHRYHLGAVLGRSAQLLLEGIQGSWEGRAQIGMVAGSTGWGVGRLLGSGQVPGDGTVSVAETRWSGLHEHVVVPATHSGLVVSRAAAEQVISFLRCGHFTSAAPREPVDPTGSWG